MRCLSVIGIWKNWVYFSGIGPVIIGESICACGLAAICNWESSLEISDVTSQLADDSIKFCACGWVIICNWETSCCTSDENSLTQYRMTWRVQNFKICNGKKCVKYSMNGHESTFNYMGLLALQTLYTAWSLFIDAPYRYRKKCKWSLLVDGSTCLWGWTTTCNRESVCWTSVEMSLGLIGACTCDCGWRTICKMW